jgi:hypothetical protein
MREFTTLSFPLYLHDSGGHHTVVIMGKVWHSLPGSFTSMTNAEAEGPSYSLTGVLMTACWPKMELPEIEIMRRLSAESKIEHASE